MATHKEQLTGFLDWLRSKRDEIVADYWFADGAAQKIYRRMLLNIQSEIWLTEHKLGRLNNVQTNSQAN